MSAATVRTNGRLCSYVRIGVHSTLVSDKDMISSTEREMMTALALAWVKVTTALSQKALWEFCVLPWTCKVLNVVHSSPTRAEERAVVSTPDQRTSSKDTKAADRNVLDVKGKSVYARAKCHVSPGRSHQGR